MLRLPNLDGKIITVGNNQNLALMPKFPDFYVGITEYHFATAATSSSNTVKITTEYSTL